MALDLKDTAKRLIRNLAAKAEDGVFYIVNETGGSENPNTGEWTPGAVSRTPTDGARVAYAQNLIDGVNIRTGDFQLIIPFDSVLPSDCWIESVDRRYDENGLPFQFNTRYSIIGQPEVNHAGQVQLYKLQLRRS